jgi:integrase
MKNRGQGFCFQPRYRDKKTGEKKPTATWWISYSDHGKRFKENAHTTSQTVAGKLLKLRIGQAGIGRPVAPQTEKTSLDDLIAMVEAHYKANALKSGKRIPIAAKHLREFFGGDCKAREITSDRITAYVAHRQEQKAARATINVEQAFLSRGFRLAAKAGKVGARPEMSRLKLDNARQGFFEAAQFEAVVRHLPEHLQPLVQVAYLTGWRRGEILTRQWRHVDLKLGSLRLEPGETKNGAGRSFPFHNFPELREVLMAQRERVSEIEKTSGQIIPWVFINSNGMPLVDFRNAWRTACREAGCPGKLLHDFRRTAIRNFERRGVSRSAGMALSGHLTASIYSRYSITDSKVLEEAVEKLTSQMSDQKSPSSVKVSTLPVKRARKNP